MRSFSKSAPKGVRKVVENDEYFQRWLLENGKSIDRHLLRQKDWVDPKKRLAEREWHFVFHWCLDIHRQEGIETVPDRPTIDPHG